MNIRLKRSIESQYDEGVVSNLPQLLGLHGICECGDEQFIHDGDDFSGKCSVISCACQSYRDRSASGGVA